MGVAYVRGAVKSIREQSPLRLDVSFFDWDGAPETPTTIHYRVDLLGAKPAVNIRAWTQFSPVGQSVSITLDVDDNEFYSAQGNSEVHIVTVAANQGQADEMNEQFLYEVEQVPHDLDIAAGN